MLWNLFGGTKKLSVTHWVPGKLSVTDLSFGRILFSDQTEIKMISAKNRMFFAVFSSRENLELRPINKQSEKCRRKSLGSKHLPLGDPHKQGLKAYSAQRSCNSFTNSKTNIDKILILKVHTYAANHINSG